MKTVYILRLSQLTQSEIKKSVTDFAVAAKIDPIIIQLAAHAEGGSPLNHYPPQELKTVRQGAIYLFKTGLISEEEFIEKMNQAMEIALSKEVFTKCWNAMCIQTPDSLAFLRSVEELQRTRGFHLHIMSNTNSLHTNCIDQQLAANGIHLEMSHTYSFETHQLESEPPTAADPQWADFDIVDLRDTKTSLISILDTDISPTLRPKLSP